MGEAVKATEEAFRELYWGTAIMPDRQSLNLTHTGGWLGVMPAFLRRAEALSTKVVTVFGRNPEEHGLPTTMATIILNDPLTGKPTCIMDGSYLTAVRTGAAGGVAAKLLSRSNSRRLGVFGSGTQARTQVEGVLTVRTLESVKIFSRMFDHAAKLAKELEEKHGVRATAVRSPQEAVEGCDIVVTATTSPSPVFDGNLLSEGTHVNCIGAHTPNTRELDSAAITRAKVVVDQREAALKEAGDILIPISEGLITSTHIYAELGEIVAGAMPGRSAEDWITVFKSCGLAVQDAVIAKMAFSKAVESGIGYDFPMP